LSARKPALPIATRLHTKPFLAVIWIITTLRTDGISTTPSNNNAHHIVIGVNLSASTVLDGFILTGGYANGYSDISCNGQYVKNGYGGGMYNRSSSPTLTNVTIAKNTADYGGGMYNDKSSPMLTNVTIANNTANNLGAACLIAILPHRSCITPFCGAIRQRTVRASIIMITIAIRHTPTA
jgi:hypothetical protein